MKKYYRINCNWNSNWDFHNTKGLVVSDDNLCYGYTDAKYSQLIIGAFFENKGIKIYFLSPRMAEQSAMFFKVTLKNGKYQGKVFYEGLGIREGKEVTIEVEEFVPTPSQIRQLRNIVDDYKMECEINGYMGGYICHKVDKDRKTFVKEILQNDFKNFENSTEDES